jgi:hypothetical protein
MAKSKIGGFMAGFIPKISKEPSVREAYKGCSVYHYIDTEHKKQWVMFDQDYKVKEGNEEVRELGCKCKIEQKYELFLIEKVI